MKLKNLKSNISVLLILLTTMTIFASELINFFKSLPSETAIHDINLIQRGIETPFKLWITGYLGSFFNTTWYGVWPLLLAPILVLKLIRFKALPQWQKSFLLFFVPSLILVSLKGFFNPRYALTLLPVSILVVHFFLYGFFKASPRKPKVYIALCLSSLVISAYGFAAKGGSLIFDSFAHYRPKLQAHSDWLNTINSLPLDPGQKYLNNNFSYFYYYTKAPAIYYWAGSDLMLLKRSKTPLIKKHGTGRALATALRDVYHVRYITSPIDYLDYNRDFKRFVEDFCYLKWTNQNLMICEVNTEPNYTGTLEKEGINFSLNGNSDRFTTHSFYAREAEWSWTKGNYATVCFQRSNVRKAKTLILEIVPFLGLRKFQALSVQWMDRKLGNYQVDKSMTLEIPMNMENIEGGGCFEFYIPMAHSPHEAHVANDSRIIAIGLKNLKVLSH